MLDICELELLFEDDATMMEDAVAEWFVTIVFFLEWVDGIIIMGGAQLYVYICVFLYPTTTVPIGKSPCVSAIPRPIVNISHTFTYLL